jgi:alpha-tubulin suppressor-like RCC1 family protein
MFRRCAPLILTAVLGAATALPAVGLYAGSAAAAVDRIAAADRHHVTALSITTHKLPDGRVGVAYHQKLVAKGGHGHRKWAATGVPAGLKLSAGGVLSGVPKKARKYHVTVRVRDARGKHVKRRLTLVIKPPYPHAVKVTVGNSGGQSFSCALTTTGAVKCWGVDNIEGELGDGTTKAHTTPANVKGLSSGAKDVSVATEFGCAVTSARGVKCWGWEESGELGNGTDDANAHSSLPVQVHGLSSGVRSVSTGGNQACAVTTGGAVKCWGDVGQIAGAPPSGESTTPLAVPGLASGIASVSIGDGFGCALTTSGAVKCWGANDSGQLGDGNQDTSNVPVAVTGLSSGVRSLGTGGTSACAVTGSGAAMCWGDNGMGQLGDNRAEAFATTPVRVTGMKSGQAKVSQGEDGTACAVGAAGGAKCWGYNYDGQLGNGTETDSYVPVKVKGLSTGVKSVSASTYTVCVVMTGGGIKCWGYVPTTAGISDSPVTIRGFG